MAAKKPNPDRRINLSDVSVLLVDNNRTSSDILSQVLSGFGVRAMTKAETAKEALKILQAQSFDFIMADANLPEMDGYRLVQKIRRLPDQTSATTPIMVLSSHTRQAAILRARDSGANFVILKPITPKVLLDRIQWIAQEERMFVQTKSYAGPDRRFKRIGPPPGMKGRRADDLSAELGEASTPNLSQDQIDGLFKPMKVML